MIGALLAYMAVTIAAALDSMDRLRPEFPHIKRPRLAVFFFVAIIGLAGAVVEFIARAVWASAAAALA